MKTTGTHVYTPTSNCIWNSFQNSKKKHIIITGNRRIGKSTLLHTLFPNSLPGITTWAEPQKAVYLKENNSDKVVKVAVYDASLNTMENRLHLIGDEFSALGMQAMENKIRLTGDKFSALGMQIPENKMRLVGDGFSTLGISALEHALSSDSEWVSIDEIGYVESQCPDYLDMISHIMENKHVIAVVRKQNLPHLQNLCTREDVFLIDLDAPFGNMGCVIMASGLGKRFGENKLMADFHGRPLISYVLDATSGIFQKRVVVTRHKDVAKLCENRNVDVIFHDLPYRNDTIRLGLEKLLDMEHCMFCTSDQPLLKQDTIAALALLAVNAPAKIIRPICENTPGSPVIFPQWTFDELLRLPEGKGGGYIIKQYSDMVDYLSIAESHELEDIDTLEDFIRLQKILNLPSSV